MAEIRFQLLKQANGQPALASLSGSGLAFYGATAGSSVQIGAYQGTTFVANADGSTYKDETNNIKYKTTVFPSGQCNIGGAFGTATDIGLSGIKSFQGTLGIEFGHTAAVKVQNCQLRVYDRTNVNYPASGVNTKIAEIANHNGSTFNNQGSDGQTSAAVGSGDALWWGEPWPSELVTKNYYTNSAGVVFYNGLDSATNTNGDIRLSQAAVAGSYDTVGGTGIIVPLLDSPGSGQKQLQASEVVSGTGMTMPKWSQYINNNTNQSTFFGDTQQQFGDGSDTAKVAGLAPIDKTYGGTGVDTHHTWSVAISAAPLSTGSKEDYGLYCSLEYL
tara:strand:+ start:2192 stop:3184 length:993 start_codon:yes stop_codon:yes gene_type:complete